MKRFSLLVVVLLLAFASPDSYSQKAKTPAKGAAKKSAPKVMEVPADKPIEKVVEKTVEKLPDYEALAKKLVNQCANIKEEQSVLITGNARDIALLEDIAVNVRKVGAFPLITVSSDKLVRRMVDEVPAKYDDQLDDYAKSLLKSTNALISIDAGENEGLLADIPAARLAARGKAGQELNNVMVKRNIIGVNLGNGLYPTASRAKQYGLSQQQLAKIFWAGVNTNYDTLQAVGERFKQLLAAAQEIVITTPGGTNLKVTITGRQPHVSDGVISEADVSEGYASSNAYLPAGEVFITPQTGTAEGKVVAEKIFFTGKEIKGLTVEVKEGKVTSMTAASGIESLKALYDATGDGKDEFAFIDFGINRDVAIPAGSSMIAWMPAGMVTVGIGNNNWAGGDNDSAFSLPLFLVNCTVTIDGTTVVDHGKLKI